MRDVSIFWGTLYLLNVYLWFLSEYYGLGYVVAFSTGAGKIHKVVQLITGRLVQKS